MARRVEQRTDDNGRDELEATEGLLRSSNSDVITMESFMVMALNTGSPSNAREGSGACGASNEKKNMEGPG